jgi:hypothetical protein
LHQQRDEHRPQVRVLPQLVYVFTNTYDDVCNVDKEVRSTL